MIHNSQFYHPAFCFGTEENVVHIDSATSGTLRLAREGLNLSNSEIEERIAAFKARPPDQQDGGVLHNWLSRPRSYVRKPNEPQRLKLQQGLSPPQERQRADLIRYGRMQGWSHAQLQVAIERFESKLNDDETH